MSKRRATHPQSLLKGRYPSPFWEPEEEYTDQHFHDWTHGKPLELEGKTREDALRNFMRELILGNLTPEDLNLDPPQEALVRNIGISGLIAFIKTQSLCGLQFCPSRK